MLLSKGGHQFKRQKGKKIPHSGMVMDTGEFHLKVITSCPASCQFSRVNRYLLNNTVKYLIGELLPFWKNLLWAHCSWKHLLCCTGSSISPREIVCMLRMYWCLGKSSYCLTLPLSNFVTWNKSPAYSLVSWFPYMNAGTVRVWLLWEINELIHAQHSE